VLCDCLKSFFTYTIARTQHALGNVAVRRRLGLGSLAQGLVGIHDL